MVIDFENPTFGTLAKILSQSKTTQRKHESEDLSLRKETGKDRGETSCRTRTGSDGNYQEY